ncbi:MAG: hypothetical protein K2P41_00520 [Lachnospiraceae bacterium]|nr:hypothetical protein [Lachnospiraceae bacterium]
MEIEENTESQGSVEIEENTKIQESAGILDEQEKWFVKEGLSCIADYGCTAYGMWLCRRREW